MTWLAANWADVWDLSVRHLWLSVRPIVIGFLLAVPLGLAAWRYTWLRGGLLSVIGLLYTIPSLALFVLLPPVIGISVLADANLIIALSIYAVALMTRFAADAFASVDESVRRSAVAVGYSPWRRFWAVDLPLAGPALLAGLRVVTVSTVSLVTVGILVGIDSLGLLFTDGLQRGIMAEIATGIVMTVVIALVLDLLLALGGRLLMPWARRPPRRRRSGTSASAVASVGGAAGEGVR
ncbi:ABC transporter permease [Ruania zhangjianzhongii]|uniref:ABC transporter permease n=1 Tax=Ruania zhangjianzhongii TaxID=2603206 RepID=UPI0011CC8BE5|nr:ABC transporter permease subunit [Ruania zhangjianzhongii]